MNEDRVRFKGRTERKKKRKRRRRKRRRRRRRNGLSTFYYASPL